MIAAVILKWPKPAVCFFTHLCINCAQEETQSLTGTPNTVNYYSCCSLCDLCTGTKVEIARPRKPLTPCFRPPPLHPHECSTGFSWCGSWRRPGQRGAGRCGVPGPSPAWRQACTEPAAGRCIQGWRGGFPGPDALWVSGRRNTSPRWERQGVVVAEHEESSHPCMHTNRAPGLQPGLALHA